MLSTIACGPKPESPAQQSNQPAIQAAQSLGDARDADANWSKAASEHNLEATVAFYAPDAMLLPPGSPALIDNTSIRSFWKAFFKTVDTLSWQADRFEIATSGEVAWETGRWTSTGHNSQGAILTRHGKLTEVWKKQPDGSWKCSVDIFNDDAPAK
jgi:ketosteroid isomerase-like protein